jgi:hypothetical protein
MSLNIVDTLIEVNLKNPDDFLKVRETLTRIGIASRQDRVLYQSCHILHKRQKYYIVHFKELFKLDGKPSSLNDSDLARRNTIVNMLAEWNLVDIVNPELCSEPRAPISQIKILPYKEKGEWRLEAKYNIGNKKA